MLPHDVMGTRRTRVATVGTLIVGGSGIATCRCPRSRRSVCRKATRRAWWLSFSPEAFITSARLISHGGRNGKSVPTTAQPPTSPSVRGSWPL